MNFILIIIAIIAVVLIAVLVRQLSKKKIAYPYIKEPFLLSPAERLFFGALEQSAGETYRIFSKVRVADIVGVKKGIERKVWQSAFNRISSKHFDFVLVNPEDFSVVAAIELDDKSHKRTDRMDRDDFLDNVCKAANLKIIRFEARSSYSTNEIRQKIEMALNKGLRIVTSEPSAILQRPVFFNKTETSKMISKEQKCPNCGAQMIRRTSRSGNNAGKAFWGCSNFPKCRGIITI